MNCEIVFILLIILHLTHVKSQVDPYFYKPEEGACQSIDIRNSIIEFHKLDKCKVIEGNLQIVLIDDAVPSSFLNLSFPLLTEITGYLLFYRVHGLGTLTNLFPNLAVIRGHTLLHNYALIIFEMLSLQEIALPSLTNILRGSVHISKNPLLCFSNSVDWDLIAPNGIEDHFILDNKKPNECPTCLSYNHTCPRSNDGKNKYCWSLNQCQIVCPKTCQGACTTDGKCCHRLCLGGCTDESIHTCIACKHLLYQNTCIEKCPANTYEYLNRRCILESECYEMPKPKESDSNIRPFPYKPYQDKCVLSCPNKYLEEEQIINGVKRFVCKKCQGVCKKECIGGNVDSISAAQNLKGCTFIKGALEIQIRGTNVVKELEENLKMIEEIEDYLKIVRSLPLISLNFLKNLKAIHGKRLESNKYALVVLDNPNLMELWDWKNRNSTVEIRHGKMVFHFNSKLCLSKIEEFRELARLPMYTELEVSSSNGNKIACNLIDLNATVYHTEPTAALMMWEQFQYYDSRSLLGYVVYSIEAPFKNVTMYDGRDACGGDKWRVDDVAPPSSERTSLISNRTVKAPQVNHILTRLKPYTQYAYYIKTYMIATERSGGQSAIKYFRTKPFIPSEPQFVNVQSNSSDEIVINWQPPSEPNGNVTYYLVALYWKKDSEDYIEQQNYCLKPIRLPDTNIVKDKQKSEIISKGNRIDSDDSCDCNKNVIDVEREKIIRFEDRLQNQIYYKRYNSNQQNRVKRELSNFEFYDNDQDTLLNDSVKGFRQIVYGTSISVKNLKHFALYNIAIKACREWENGEKIDPPKNCSKEAIAASRTLQLAGADDIDSDSLQWNISNSSFGIVQLKWAEPSNPNSVILTYEIEYKRADVENYLPTKECITRKQFLQLEGTYTIKNLNPGNYSIRIRATSLAGDGNYTKIKYFVIEEIKGVTNIQIFLIVVVLSFFIIIILLTIYARYYLNRYPKLIASVNPDYVPSLYVPDEWEVCRLNIELGKEIGQGSFGMVYEGLLTMPENKTKFKCAVKTVNVQAAERERMEFLSEASVMKAFNTNHVVKLLGVVSQGLPTLVIMELMRNGDLKTFLRLHRSDNCDNPNAIPPTLNRILRMATEIADGMAYLTAKKFVHRDLAARNCMVAEDLTVKVGDFGMTRDVYETDYYRKGSKGLLPVRWMAPESLKDGVFTSLSDVWSYGVVLYEMATSASQPYQGLGNQEVLKYVMQGGIISRPHNCPDKLYDIMVMCWHQKPSERPTFLELVGILQQFVTSDFKDVSFYDSREGQELRGTIGNEETPLRITREIEDFSLTDDDADD